MVVDQVFLDYMNSTAPAPSQQSLDAVLSEARRVRIFRGGAASGQPLGTEVLFETDDDATVSALRTTLLIVDGPFGHCMCHGDPTIELLGASGTRLALIGVHHGVSIRWDAWHDDAKLAEGRSLLQWISDRGVSYPMESYEEDLRREEAAQLDRIRWLAAVPACLKRFACLGHHSGRNREMAEMLRALEEAYPDPSERAAALFSWYGSRAGPWSPCPAYESYAGELLLTLRIEALVKAACSPGLGEAGLEGAARFFAGWEFTTKRRRELTRLPDSAKRTLLEHSLRSADSDKRARAQKAFGWIM